MITLNDLKNIDLKNIDLTKFDMPTFDRPEFDMPELPVDRIAGFARDAAYAGLGVIVLSAQKADERRRELTDQVTDRVRKLVDAVA